LHEFSEENINSAYSLFVQDFGHWETRRCTIDILVFYIGSTFANNCSHCDLDYNLYPRLEQTNGKLHEDGDNFHCDDGDEVDTEQDIKNEAPLFAISKR
jgi:hypothetical protein